MKELKVDSINNYDYNLVDIYGKEYRMNIEVRGANINVGDFLILNENILRDKVVTFEVVQKSDLMLISGDTKIYLKRIYG